MIHKILKADIIISDKKFLTYSPAIKAMTIKFSNNSDEKLIVTNLSGRIKDNELINSFKNFYADNKSSAHFSQLIVVDESTDFDLGTDSFIQLSKMADDFLKNNESTIKTAFVTDKTMHKVMTDTYQSISEVLGSSAIRKTFTEVKPALEWLDINPSSIDITTNN